MSDPRLPAALYCFAVAAVFLGLWLYYDRRDHALFEAQRRRTTFHCVRCDHTYSAHGRLETQPCPHCGYVNARLKF